MATVLVRSRCVEGWNSPLVPALAVRYRAKSMPGTYLFQSTQNANPLLYLQSTTSQAKKTYDFEAPSSQETLISTFYLIVMHAFLFVFAPDIFTILKVVL